MSALASLEDKLNEALVEKSPVQLPEGARKWIATYSWVFALVGALWGALAVLLLLPALGFASVVGTAVGAGGYVIFAWLAFMILVGYVVLMGVATPKLKRMEKAGWDLIFYSSLFYFVYGLFDQFRFFSAASIFSIVWLAFVTVVEFFFIFQIRSYFLKNKASVPAEKKTKKA